MQKRRRRAAGAFERTPGGYYLRALLTSENSADSLVPSWPRMVTRAIAINEAISAYSMAVAPDSSDAKSFTNFISLLHDAGDGLPVAGFRYGAKRLMIR